VLRSYGVSGLQAHIRGHIKLGKLFHSLVQSRPDIFSIVTGPTFALTVLTIVPRTRQRRISANQPDPTHERYLNDFSPDAKAQALLDANSVTKEVYELVNRRGEIFLTSAVVGGRYAIEILVETSEEVCGRVPKEEFAKLQTK
jgi:aromatic-L-amino-acid decarboxylase